MRTILSALALLALAACSTGPAFQTQTAAVQTISFPALHQVTTAPAHEAMIAGGTQNTANSVLDIRQMTVFGKEPDDKTMPIFSLCGFAVAPGRYYQTEPAEIGQGLGKLRKKVTCYGPVPTKRTNADGTSSIMSCIGKQIPDSRVCVDGNTFYSVQPLTWFLGRPTSFAFAELKKDFQNISIINESNNGSRSLVKEFRYVKRDDNIFYFTYREYDDYPHHVVSEAQYQYDLSATNVIAFGNMRAQIINANDSQVEFTLLSNF
ncbi:MAG: hypothetical protein ABF335_06490 [Alphaproteobacteria bacterium]